MKKIHFASLDLNLLRVFAAIMDEGSVIRAAENLAVTPSTVSHALGRLRFALDDHLFVRTSDAMRPTPYAAEIGPKLRALLRQLEEALTPVRFAPKTTDRIFTITASAYTCAVFLPGLVARLRREAPRAQLRILSSDSKIADDLDQGHSDIAIGSFGRVPSRFESAPLLWDRMVWAIGKENAPARGRLTLARLAAMPHLVVAVRGEGARTVDGVLNEGGLERRMRRDDHDTLTRALRAKALTRTIGMTVPDARTALTSVVGTDMAALVPLRLARPIAKQLGLRLYVPPYSSHKAEIRALWSIERGRQLGVAWLRGLIADTAAKLDLDPLAGAKWNMGAPLP